MKLNTLKKRSEFVDLQKKGKRISTKGVVVEFLLIEGGQSNEQPHLGFTVSGKVGSAVYRNKAKRKLKEAVRDIMRTSPKLLKANYRYNFIGRFSTIERDLNDLVKDIKYALHNVK